MTTTHLKNFSWKLTLAVIGCLSLLTACADNVVKKRGPASSTVEQQVVILDFLDSGLTANHKTWEVFAEVFSNVVQEITEVRLVEKNQELEELKLIQNERGTFIRFSVGRKLNLDNARVRFKFKDGLVKDVDVECTRVGFCI